MFSKANPVSTEGMDINITVENTAVDINFWVCISNNLHQYAKDISAFMLLLTETLTESSFTTHKILETN